MAAKQQRAREIGQGDLFLGGSESDNKAHEIPLPNAADYPPEEILRIEKDLLGIYVSGHPLARYREAILRETTETVETIAERGNRERIRIGGIISSVRTLTTKLSGEPMARFEIEDITGSKVTVIAFPDAFASSRAHIAVDKVVIVEGVTSIQEPVSEGEDVERRAIVEIHTASVRALNPGFVAGSERNGVARSIVVSLSDSHLPVWRTLQSAIESSPGDATLRFHFLANGQPMRKRLAFGVSADNEFIQLIEQLVGKQAISVE